MGNIKLYPLFRTGYSSEIPEFTENTGDETVDVTKYSKVKINVPVGTLDDTVTLEEFVAMRKAGELENGKTYPISI